MPSPRLIANLDRAAGEAPAPEIAALYPELCARYALNPHGITCFAEEARRALIAAEEELLEAMGISAGEATVIWCATGTEAINLALRGAAAALPAAPICYDATAHPAVANTATSMGTGRNARPVRTFLLDADGALPRTAFPACIGPSIVALSLVNNENGARWNADRSALPPGTVLLADGCQCLGKHPIPWDEAHLDLLIVSGRKIGGPSAAALVCRRGTRLQAVTTGGSQQNRLRAGTIDVPSAILLAKAAARSCRSAVKTLPRISALKAQLLAGLNPEWPVFSPANASPYITLFAVPGHDGAVIARILAQHHGVLVGTGSACAAEHGDPSPTLTALGIPKDIAQGALRVSFSRDSSHAEVAAFLDALPKTLAEW